MARDVPATIESVVAAKTNLPVELYEIYLDSGTLYYAAAETDIVFGGVTYLACGAKRGAISTSTELTVDQVQIDLSASGTDQLTGRLVVG